MPFILVNRQRTLGMLLGSELCSVPEPVEGILFVTSTSSVTDIFSLAETQSQQSADFTTLSYISRKCVKNNFVFLSSSDCKYSSVIFINRNTYVAIYYYINMFITSNIFFDCISNFLW